MKRIYAKYLKKAALIWSGCLLVFVLVYLLVIAPQSRNKKHIKKQFAQKMKTYNSVLKMAQHETKLELNGQIENLRDKLKDFVIAAEDSANLTFDISRIADDKKIVPPPSIKSRGLSADSAIPDCEYIQENHIDISFTAGFNQFAAFLNSLERHRPVVFVDRFTITREKSDAEKPEVTMGLAVFVKKQQSS